MRNLAWHRDNPTPIYPRAAVLGWHLRHEAARACRPISEVLLEELDALGIVVAGHVERMAVVRAGREAPALSACHTKLTRLRVVG